MTAGDRRRLQQTPRPIGQTRGHDAPAEPDAAVIFSGMPGQTRDAWVAAWAGAVPCRTEAGQLPAGTVDTTIVVFYQSPWNAFIEHAALRDFSDEDAGSKWLGEWLNYHTAVIDAQRTEPRRILLVNADAVVDPGQLIECVLAAGSALPAVAGSAPREAHVAPTWMRDLLAGHFAEHAPELWECYEALEACAAITFATPQFRGDATLVDVTAVAGLLGTVIAACADLATLADDIHDATNATGLAAEREQTLEASLLELRQENELLVQQVAQMHRELDLAGESTRAAEAAAKQLEQLRREHATLREQFEEAMTMAKSPELTREVREENEMLSLQIGQLHAELEALHQENGGLREFASRAGGLAERARLALSRLAVNRRAS